MAKRKVRVGNARCMCHGHHVSRDKAGNFTSEFGVHDGGRTYIERYPVSPGDPLYEKATALFALHDGQLAVDEQILVLRKYGQQFTTFKHGSNCCSNFIGEKTVDGQIVGVGVKVFFNGDLIALEQD